MMAMVVAAAAVNEKCTTPKGLMILDFIIKNVVVEQRPETYAVIVMNATYIIKFKNNFVKKELKKQQQ